MDAAQYLEHWKRNRVWTHLQWPKHQLRLKRCTELAVGGRFLDFGCAFGHSTAIMAGFLPGAWLGLDMAKEAIETAWIMQKASGIVFIYAPTLPLPPVPFPQEVDTVICSEVLEHVESPFDLLESLSWIARYRIVLSTPSVRVSDPGHLRLYDQAGLEALLSQYGVEHRIYREPPFFYAAVDLRRFGNG